MSCRIPSPPPSALMNTNIKRKGVCISNIKKIKNYNKFLGKPKKSKEAFAIQNFKSKLNKLRSSKLEQLKCQRQG